MKIITRYVFKECLISTLMTLSIFVAVLLTGKVLKLANLIINKGVDLYNVCLVFINIIPTFLEIAVPLSILLGVMITINRLSLDSEIVVLKSTGMSIKKLVLPILVLGLIGTALCYYITFSLRPAAHKNLQNTLFEIAKSRATAGLSAGSFNKLGKLVIYAEKIENGNNLQRVVIDDQRDEKNRKITFSHSGLVTGDPAHSSILINLSDGTIHERTPQNYSLTDFDNNLISISTDEIFNLEETAEQRTSEMVYQDLKDAYLKAPKGKRKNNLNAEIYRRYAFPLACVILSVLGLCFGISAPRNQKSWGPSLAICLGLIVYVFYYGLSSIGMSLAHSIPAYIACWLTNIIFACTTWYFLNKISNEKWSSITDAIFDLFGRLKKS